MSTKEKGGSNDNCVNLTSSATKIICVNRKNWSHENSKIIYCERIKVKFETDLFIQMLIVYEIRIFKVNEWCNYRLI